MTTTAHTIDTGATVMAKATPPITVSIASLAGYNVSELLVWDQL